MELDRRFIIKIQGQPGAYIWTLIDSLLEFQASGHEATELDAVISAANLAKTHRTPLPTTTVMLSDPPPNTPPTSTPPTTGTPSN